jgi:alpha-beta hydrolase superfamily lysophospholipase
MDTAAQIIDSCKNNPTSKWERYVCATIGAADTWGKCWPQRRHSRCNSTVGVVALFHGYSACPDAYNELASTFQDQCLQVYSFLSPGHGHPLLDNSTGQLLVPSSNPNYVDRFNLTGLPTSRACYVDFANHVNEVIKEEKQTLEVDNELRVTAALGLSLGAPMATAAAVQSEGLYSHLLVISPFFGVSSDAADQPVADVDKCLQTRGLSQCLCDVMSTFSGMQSVNSTAQKAICDLVQWYVGDVHGSIDLDFQGIQVALRAAFEWVVENWDQVPAQFQAALETPVGWGDQCQSDIDNQDRGGFCNFRARHLLAAHSMGQYAVRASAKSTHKMNVFMAPTERDGRTRNGMVFQSLQALNRTGSRAAACMWFKEAGCTGPGNTCGVPHSSAAPADNLGVAPHTLYWNDTEYKGVANFFTSSGIPPPGADTAPPNWNVKKWDLSRDQCVNLDVNQPPSSLVAPIPQAWQVTVAVQSAVARSVVENAVIAGLAKLTGVDEGVLKFLCRFLSPDGPVAPPSIQHLQGQTQLQEPVQGHVNINLMLPAATSNALQQILAVAPGSKVTAALAYPLISATVGQQAVPLVPSTPTPSPPERSWRLPVLISVSACAATALVTYKVTTGRQQKKSDLSDPLVDRHSLNDI